jgi:cytochrome c peroxidase
MDVTPAGPALPGITHHHAGVNGNQAALRRGGPAAPVRPTGQVRQWKFWPMTSINDISMAITFDEAEDMGAFKLAKLRAVALTRPLFGAGDVAEAGSAGRIMSQIPRG